MQQIVSQWMDFHKILYLSIFRLSVKNQVSLKSDKNNGLFTWRPICIFIIYLSVPLRMRNVSDNTCRENGNTHFMFSNFFFLKWWLLWRNMEEYSRAGEAKDDNMVLAHFTLGTWGYKHTLSEFVILIAFPLQQRLHESASMSRYSTYLFV
jgi:hypothetical protein